MICFSISFVQLVGANGVVDEDDEADEEDDDDEDDEELDDEDLDEDDENELGLSYLSQDKIDVIIKLFVLVLR